MIVVLSPCGAISCWWAAELHQATFSLPLLNGTGKENAMRKASWVEVRKGDHSVITITGKTDSE